MSKIYSINIEIDDVSFSSANEPQIEEIRSKLEDNIRRALDTRITTIDGDIKIVFNEEKN
jgi:hypothetical protein